MLRNMLLCLLTLLVQDQVGKKDTLVKGMLTYKKISVLLMMVVS